MVIAVKKNPAINNTIYSCSVAHPTYCARRHCKITDLLLTYWATQFLIHPCSMCKPKKDVPSTCASVSHISNSFLEEQSSAQKALRPCGDVSTARPKETVQCLSEDLTTVPAKVLDKATFSLFALTHLLCC